MRCVAFGILCQSAWILKTSKERCGPLSLIALTFVEDQRLMAI